mmetsp:Transcript_43417/g.140821  ORF Transcript_43417/g.140821 Transcript_43417/m.140821 type:complete len:222 (-) Transcript_43417:271-936(-)
MARPQPAAAPALPHVPVGVDEEVGAIRLDGAEAHIDVVAPAECLTDRLAVFMRDHRRGDREAGVVAFGAFTVHVKEHCARGGGHDEARGVGVLSDAHLIVVSAFGGVQHQCERARHTRVLRIGAAVAREAERHGRATEDARGIIVPPQPVVAGVEAWDGVCWRACHPGLSDAPRGRPSSKHIGHKGDIGDWLGHKVELPDPCGSVCHRNVEGFKTGGDSTP